MAKYTIGIDYGSLSVRALVVNVENGDELASEVFDYPHAVISEELPCGKKLPPDWALQHPQDYLDGLGYTVRRAVEKAGIDKNDIIGIGVDFTCNTYLPMDKNGTPLCFDAKWAEDPHSWCKMWKHHATQEFAQRMEKLALERNEPFIKRYSGKVSPIWMFPRLLETLEVDPELYHAADKFIEAGDWIVYKLTGNERRSLGMAGYKAFWSKKDGFPPDAYFAALNPEFEHVVDEKLSRDIYALGDRAGLLNEEGAEMLGLPAGIPVAVANVDAHVSFPSMGLAEVGNLVMIIGTSTCHVMIGAEEKEVSGVAGVVEDGVIPGTFGYESGQNCVGDSLKWFVDNCVPESYTKKAAAEGKDIHRYLTELASKLRPGENGLIALDWWNGNRSVLCDYDLTGMMVGMTIATKPEEMYRALIESTAFGTRRIIDSFADCGIPVTGLYACGGISKKNAMFMQIYADVTGMDIHIARSEQNPALGSAIFGAVAAGKENGGYDSVREAAKKMGGTSDVVYHPNKEAVTVYDQLYADFLLLHDYFGLGANDVMKRLKKFRRQ